MTTPVNSQNSALVNTEGQIPSGSKGTSLPDVEKLTRSQAAHAYMAAGIFVFPVDGKMPVKTASGQRARWSEQSTADTEAADQWAKGYWNPGGENSEHRKGLGIDCGKSGVVVVDVDRPDEVPPAWRGILRMAPFVSTDAADLRRGHYYFSQPEGGIGCPKAAWGEIKGIGGYVILPPSPHAAADQTWPDKQTPEKKYRSTARYLQVRHGRLSPLPALIADTFGEHRDARAAASADEIASFVEKCRGSSDQYLLGNIIKSFHTLTDRGEGRHPTMQACLVWAAKAAGGGLIPADLAHDSLESAFIQVKGDEAFPTEFEDMWEWAIGQATEEEVASFMTARAERQMGYEADRDAVPLDPYEEDMWGGLMLNMTEVAEDPEHTEDENAAPPPNDGPSRQRIEAGQLAPPSVPREAAKDIRSMYWLHEGKPTMRHWRGQWMQWTGAHWDEIDKNDLVALLYEFTGDAVYAKVTKEETKNVPWNPTKSKITNLEHALAALLNLNAKTETGAWIGGFDGSVHGTTVAVANGLLRVKDRRLAPHTPDFFNISSTPYDYVSGAECPQWLAFLEDIFEHDPGAAGVLQEWFGYVVSGRTDLQKMFQIIGPKRSGKGTIARILQAMVGEANCCGPQMSALTTDFGMTGFVKSTLAVIGDARLAGRGTGEIVERLLSVSGEDTVQINRKYKDPWQGRVPARIMLLSNITPNFGDDGGALPSRFISLTTVKDRSGKEDVTLEGRLLTELAGILNWALDGLDRLEKTNRFSGTAAGTEILEMQNEGASPTKEFGTEKCTMDESLKDENCWVTKTVLAAHFEAWTEQHGYGEEGKGMRTNIPAFSRKIKAAFPWVKVTNQKRRVNGVKVPVYVGIKLTDALTLLTPTITSPAYTQPDIE